LLSETCRRRHKHERQRRVQSESCTHWISSSR
jgi:hypothetical protein